MTWILQAGEWIYTTKIVTKKYYGVCLSSIFQCAILLYACAYIRHNIANVNASQAQIVVLSILYRSFTTLNNTCGTPQLCRV